MRRIEYININFILQEQQPYPMSRKEKILFVLIQLFFIATISHYNDIITGFITGGHDALLRSF
ncbi:MAG: hypothetical protein WDO19_10655 [Bacteroidota bacterium]